MFCLFFGVVVGVNEVSDVKAFSVIFYDRLESARFGGFRVEVFIRGFGFFRAFGNFGSFWFFWKRFRVGWG